MIQIPLLTQWLLHSLDAAFKDSGMANTMSWHQLRRLPGLFTAIDSPPPPHGLPLTYQDVNDSSELLSLRLNIRTDHAAAPASRIIHLLGAWAPPSGVGFAC